MRVTTPENPEVDIQTAVLEEAEHLVENIDLDFIEEKHAEMLVVWVNYVRLLNGVPDSHEISLEDSKAAFGGSYSEFCDYVEKYTANVLEESDSTSDAVSTLIGVGSILDRERVDALNGVSKEVGGQNITDYARREAILEIFHESLRNVSDDDERIATFSRLITFGFHDDIQALDALITRVKVAAQEKDQLSQREMVRALYEDTQNRINPSTMSHVRDIAKTALGVTIGIVLARRLK